MMMVMTDISKIKVQVNINLFFASIETKYILNINFIEFNRRLLIIKDSVMADAKYGKVI